MKVFIFQYVSEVSDNYHRGGGLTIIARDREHVEELISKEPHIELEKDDWENVTVYELSGEPEPTIFVFPDAGCC